MADKPSSSTSNSKADGIDIMQCTEPDNDKPWRGWRFLPDVDADVMIISSYGEVYPPIVSVARKLVPHDSTSRLILARQEYDCILDLYKQANKRHITYCYPDHDHGSPQASKEYYLDRIKKLLMECKRELGKRYIYTTDHKSITHISYIHTVILFYTGDSEKGTGNWCFKDGPGVISFQDIYDLYIEHFKGKRLNIISDCSYSGNWVKECAKVYDDQGILYCGHHSREKGILINVSTSCQAYQEATILAYENEAMEVVVNDLVFTGNKTLSSGQTTLNRPFSMICDNKPEEECKYTRSNQTWTNLLLRLSRRVHLVRGKDRGRPAWHFVFVDEDKVQQFKDKVATGTIDVADYGEVLYSGWGEDPPQDIIDKVDHRFGY